MITADSHILHATETHLVTREGNHSHRVYRQATVDRDGNVGEYPLISTHRDEQEAIRAAYEQEIQRAIEKIARQSAKV